MSTWTSAQLDRITAVDELEITTYSGDGAPRRRVPIWVVCVGNDVYVRSYRGRDGHWFRDVTRTGTARIRVPGLEQNVGVQKVDQPRPGTNSLQRAIDDAYRSKYARYGTTYLSPMLAPDAIAATVRLTPAAEGTHR